jgi:hypothetical protein
MTTAISFMVILWFECLDRLLLRPATLMLSDRLFVLWQHAERRMPILRMVAPAEERYRVHPAGPSDGPVGAETQRSVHTASSINVGYTSGVTSGSNTNRSDPVGVASPQGPQPPPQARADERPITPPRTRTIRGRWVVAVARSHGADVQGS